MTKFNHLNIPSHWERYWTKYPEGYTILEALIEWTSQVDVMTDNLNEWNDYLNNFVEQFEKELHAEVAAKLTEWYNDGTLATIITEEVLTDINDKIENRSLINTQYHSVQGGKTPKLWYASNDPNVSLVFSKKNKGDGYLLYRLESGVFTTTSSVGQQADLMRVTQVQNIMDVVLTQREATGSQSADGFETYLYNVVSTGFTSAQQLQMWRPRSSTTTTATDYIEFTTTVKEDGKFNICFLMTATSTNNATVKVDGVEVARYNLNATSSRLFVPEIQTTSGSKVIRIEVGQAQKNLYVGGVNFYHLKDWKGTTYDHFAYWVDNTLDYITNKGSMDYAIVDADTNLYCGSYHGGESLVSRDFYIDGVNKTSLPPGNFRVGYTVEIEQVTSIVGKLTSFTKHSFDIDGVYDFYCTLLGSMNVFTLFTCMTTTDTNYERITVPKRYNITVDEEILLGRVNKVIQTDPSSHQSITSLFTLFDKDYNERGGPFVRSVTGAYNKLYYGYAVYSPDPITVTDLSFQTTRIFDK